MPVRLEGIQALNGRIQSLYAVVEHFRVPYIIEVGAFRKRGKGQVSNAFILWLCENGSPMQNIPRRPVIKPALEENKANIKLSLKYIVKEIREGTITPQRIKKFMGFTGESLAESIRKYIKKGGKPYVPLSPETIRVRLWKGIDSIEPLYETGKLYESIKYRVKSS